MDSRRGQAGHESAEVKMRPWIAAFGSRQLHSVAGAEVHNKAMELVDEGYSINTINVSIIYWNALQNYAKANNMTPGPKIKRLKGGGNRIRFLTDDEVTKLLEQLQPENKCFREKRKAQDNLDYTEFLLATGARENEISKLELSQIDLVNNTITIHRSKGGTNTTMRLTKKLIEIVQRRLEAGTQPLAPSQTLHGRAANGFLFPERAKGRYNQGWLTAAGERAGLGHIHVHLLRHTFACKMLRNGASLLQVQQLLGHKHYASTLCYAHLAPSDVADFALAVLEPA